MPFKYSDHKQPLRIYSGPDADRLPSKPTQLSKLDRLKSARRPDGTLNTDLISEFLRTEDPMKCLEWAASQDPDKDQKAYNWLLKRLEGSR